MPADLPPQLVIATDADATVHTDQLVDTDTTLHAAITSDVLDLHADPCTG